jgi:adenine/guanine phosphoribosyltransferase-like PRPP-binding protein
MKKSMVKNILTIHADEIKANQLVLGIDDLFTTSRIVLAMVL